ncbi:DNA methyltransferase [Exiguobacterium sp. s46]|uniref:DNA methyltransferase n=1 Tax=Exiguobacterium sp. s46 TaxID=2751200 RepID=UPI001BE7D25A|nr:DNA methyltransferase [Exiguobacterium sp. s46]
MDEQEQLFFSSEAKTDNQKVVCLGLTFNNDEERRDYFRNELRKKLPQLKKIEGFPTGEDEDIIALSDPPYYTACPNPWINDFVETWNQEKATIYKRDPDEPYSCEPFSSDVSEGKNHPIYRAHSYHTKVPHRAIMKYLMHYTSPGDVVLDAFSGTGMTAVAANLCNDLSESSSIDMNSKIGNRHAIISDLSPVASFISYNYLNSNNNVNKINALQKIIYNLETKFATFFSTKHTNGEKGEINYVIWSEVYTCPSCQHEFDYWNATYDPIKDISVKDFSCPQCKVSLTKKQLNKVWEKSFDSISNKIVTLAKSIPVQINYVYNNKKFNKIPDQNDLNIIEQSNEYIKNINIKPQEISDGVNTKQPKVSNGFEYLHHFYTGRNLIFISEYLSELKRNDLVQLGMFLLTSSSSNLSKLYRWRANGKGGILAGTLYVCSTPQENNPIRQFYRKLKDIKNASFPLENQSIVSVNSATDLLISNDSIDYIFTDPPFGANLMYSELNSLWEDWLNITTNNSTEAIMNVSQNKGLSQYSNLMTKSFKEYYRVLKPGRWITVEFSNSQSNVWNAIQESLQKAGFIIANVSALDKKQNSFKAITSTIAVKQDLVISAYKPNLENINNTTEQLSPQTSWNFIEQHLEKLPIYSDFNNVPTVIIERTPRILFDRMVAYYVQRGFNVPVSSAQFQQEVTQRFPIRDGMVFLYSQVSNYDRKRKTQKDYLQTTLFISDENSAIEWIRQQLLKKPQSRQDLHSSFRKETLHISKYEQLPELDDLLSQNFLRFDDEESSVPSQILTYLRRNYPDLRGLDASHPNVIKKALHRWYVPDPNKQADLEKLREKALLREFNLYVEEMATSKKKLKVFRTEAIRAGFKKAWSEKEFQTIITVGDRLPETIIQEDDKLLMYYDNAQIKLDM